MIWLQIGAGLLLFACGLGWVWNMVDDELRRADRSEER